uniref:Uncharacterized protein n=1 Tax=Leersia perrieri TaxID=77586 RepID=A0A0D9WRG2_9ORYZ
MPPCRPRVRRAVAVALEEPRRRTREMRWMSNESVSQPCWKLPGSNGFLFSTWWVVVRKRYPIRGSILPRNPDPTDYSRAATVPMTPTAVQHLHGSL